MRTPAFGTLRRSGKKAGAATHFDRFRPDGKMEIEAEVIPFDRIRTRLDQQQGEEFEPIGRSFRVSV